jgi:hypothetical protein
MKKISNLAVVCPQINYNSSFLICFCTIWALHATPVHESEFIQDESEILNSQFYILCIRKNLSDNHCI